MGHWHLGYKEEYRIWESQPDEGEYMLNKVQLIGRIGKEPQLNGQVLNLTVAVSEKYKDKQGQWQDKTYWAFVTCFGKIAEFASKYEKGSLVYVEGKLDRSEYTDKQGNKKESTKIIAATVKNLSPKQKQTSAQSNQTSFLDQDFDVVVNQKYTTDELPF